MNRHVNAISGRLSLRPPQRESLEILDRITEIAPPRKDHDREAALDAIRAEFPGVTDFEREFPSLCFALATGVGKTRLMGAFISYLHLAHGINNFFVLAPNLTIYDKLRREFEDRNHPKYVFKGIAEFATEPPEVITGDNYEGKAGTLFDLILRCKINVFNVAKITSEVRGGNSPRIKRLSEYIGESYFDYLAGLPDLVLIMDESHRYRASAGARAINELKPVLGLELTATPFVETSRGAVAFKNVIVDYPLARAMADGFVKEPAVVTQKNFDPSQFSADELERIKLEDGVRLHENTKVELETYARQTNQPIVKPFILIIARDTTHAAQLLQTIQSDTFFEGRYADKVIQVDSSTTGTAEDETIGKLLKVESPDEPTEIVIHVNMLKEGWDVTNLYTIVPLRAANARILIEQSIGRGLRLPYGKRTGVSVVDRLSIVAHDRFQEIVDEANKPDSAIRLQQLVIDPDLDLQKNRTVVAQPSISEQIHGVYPDGGSARTPVRETPPLFATDAEKQVATRTLEAIRNLEMLPSSSKLLDTDVQQALVKVVSETMAPVQQEMAGIVERPDVQEIVRKTVALVIDRSIDIPRILIVPKGEVTTGFHAFELDCSGINYQPVERDLLMQTLRTNEQETLCFSGSVHRELRDEDYIVRRLIDFDDIYYDEHADLLYDLAGQVLRHLQSYLEEEKTRNVLVSYQRQLAESIHAQMQAHQWEKAADYEVVVSKGFTELKTSAFTAKADEATHDFRQTIQDKRRISQMVFTGFKRCLYSVQKFQSDSERKLAVILDRETLKWLKPATGQFQIFYKDGTEQREYVPDFVAETADTIFMLEPKASNEMNDPDVLAKKDSAAKWCQHASEHSAANGGKPWRYLLIPHDAIAENMTLTGLASRYSVFS